MEDIHISTNTPGAATPGSPDPTNAAPKHQGPIDQTKDAAKKLLAMITGHTKN